MHYQTLADVLPGALGTYQVRRSIHRPIMARDWWCDHSEREAQDKLVGQSLLLLRDHLHHTALKVEGVAPIPAKTGVRARIDILKSRTTIHPVLEAAFCQAQTNIMMWLHYGAASGHVGYMAKNYHNIISSSRGFLSSLDPKETYAFLVDIALTLLWGYKKGSAFAYLHRFLRLRMYSTLRDCQKGGTPRNVTIVALPKD